MRAALDTVLVADWPAVAPSPRAVALHHLRQALGMSVGQAALLLGLSVNDLAWIECGRLTLRTDRQWSAATRALRCCGYR